MNPLGARGRAPSGAEFSTDRASIHEAEQRPRAAHPSCVAQMKHFELSPKGLGWRNHQEKVLLLQMPHLEQEGVLFFHATSLAGAVPLPALPRACGALPVGVEDQKMPAERPAADLLFCHPCRMVGLKPWALLMQPPPSPTPGLVLWLGGVLLLN